MMNLKYMIELQGGLMEHIKKAKKLEEIPFEYTVTAFLVELGECLNEWRGFKYWSKNQHPRHIAITGEGKVIENRYNTPPLLEEYVDGLHFVLQKVLLTGHKQKIIKNTSIVFPKLSTIDRQAKLIYTLALKLENSVYMEDGVYLNLSHLLEYYLGLGEMLGFTIKQIEAAYIEKNRINHERQASGY
jgi:dimeric dUTPase (all-alpha-NTP-PPase superfamily)